MTDNDARVPRLQLIYNLLATTPLRRTPAKYRAEPPEAIVSTRTSITTRHPNRPHHFPLVNRIEETNIASGRGGGRTLGPTSPIPRSPHGRALTMDTESLSDLTISWCSRENNQRQHGLMGRRGSCPRRQAVTARPRFMQHTIVELGIPTLGASLTCEEQGMCTVQLR